MEPNKQEVILNSDSKVNMTLRIMKLLKKTPRTFEAVVLMMILVTVASVKGDGGCKVLDFLVCEENKTLTGHVIKSFKTLAPGIEDCQHKCFLENNCVSYNLGPVEGMVTSCELNDADHWMWPRHVVPKEGFKYCPIKNLCSSSPCSSNKICIPDFAWDSFTCVDGVWTQWTSWTACHLSDCPRNRTRNCTNPAGPQEKGTDCSGPAFEIKECQIPTVDTTGCEKPLGMENRTILDSQITASSIENNWQSYGPQGGRLNNKVVSGTVGAWTPAKTVGVYIQVDLGSVKMVTKIATQGRPLVNQWVTEYSVSYSNDTNDWTNYQGDFVKKFPGNVDRGTVATNKFEIPIIAQYIRVIVQKWNVHPSMRMELYGCTLP